MLDELDSKGMGGEEWSLCLQDGWGQSNGERMVEEGAF